MFNSKRIEKGSFLLYFDLFGIEYKWLVNGDNKVKTKLGLMLSSIYISIVIALFFGFGLDLYLRTNPKSSFNKLKNPYELKTLSNNHNILAYRIEDSDGVMIKNDAIAYLEPLKLSYELDSEGKWKDKTPYKLKVLKCRDLPNYQIKELTYNISLESWNCIDMNNIKIGGNWDGNFVDAIQINMRQCKNSTERKNCATNDEIVSVFKNPRTGGGLFFSYLYIEDLPSMNNLNEPLKSSLVNKYEMVHVSMLKRNIQTYKTVEVQSDNGWFFTNYNFYSIYSSESIQSDVLLKNEETEDIVYTYFMYLGNTKELFTRSYTKIQEVLASIGGFAKFFYIIISYFHYFFSSFPKNKFLIDMMEKTTEDKCISDNAFNYRVDSNSLNLKASRKSNQVVNVKFSKSEILEDKPKLKNAKISSYFFHYFMKKDSKQAKIIEKFKNFVKKFEEKFDISTYLNLLQDFKKMKLLYSEEINVTENKRLLEIDSHKVKKEEVYYNSANSILNINQMKKSPFMLQKE